MRNEWSATTLFMTIQKTKQIARHLAPSTNFKWLSDIAGDLRAEDGPVKHPPVVDASQLLIAGLAFVEEYSEPERPMDMRSALNIRNGLMVAMLASCPIRAKNLTGLTLGRSLHLSNSCWWIDLQGSETKNGRSDTRMIPEFLTPALESYLRKARSFLITGRDPRDSGRRPLARYSRFEDDLGADQTTVMGAHPSREGAAAAANGVPTSDDSVELSKLFGPLWVSRYGRAMTYGSIYVAVTSVTEATIGVAISPHGFRYAAATTAAWKAGNMPHLASGILQHQDRRITDASYIRASSFEAAQQFGKMLRDQ
jgi:integrase